MFSLESLGYSVRLLGSRLMRHENIAKPTAVISSWAQGLNVLFRPIWAGANIISQCMLSIAFEQG